jgi:peptidoglycan/xylan/chitin deacetylase (PgdA/CDA1 family)
MNAAAPLVRSALSVASRGRLSVLIFHRVPERPDDLLPGEPHAAEFESVLRWAKSLFSVIPLADAVAGIKSGTLPPRALAITFDDGYANNATVAAPILARLGLHATFFIATGFLDGGRMFNDTVIEAIRGSRGELLDLEPLGLGRHPTATMADRRSAIEAVLRGVKYRPEAERAELAERVAERAGVRPPSNLMMTSGQAAALAGAGFALGGHTVSHPILAQVDAATARREITQGRKRLEELAGARIGLFAYPNGRPERDYTAAATALVRELGFDGAVTTSSGAARIGSDPFQIPRFTPWDLRPLRFAAQLFLNLSRARPMVVPSSA